MYRRTKHWLQSNLCLVRALPLSLAIAAQLRFSGGGAHSHKTRFLSSRAIRLSL